MRVNKKAILDTIEWAKTALANGMRVPPVPTSQVTEDILFKRAVVVALWAFWKPEQFQRQQGAGRWKAETPTINKVLSLLQTIDNVPVLEVQVDNDGMLHVKLIGAGVEHTEEDVDGDDDPDALWYTFIYAAFTPDMIAKITGNREKKFATWGYVHSIGGPQFGLGVLKAKTSCVTVRKDGAARPVYGAVVALTNDELDKMLKVALRETGVPHVLATLGVTTKGVKGAQQMYVPVPAPGGAPNGGAGGTRDFEAQDADAAASVRKTVDSLTALPAAADAYLQLLKPQQGGQGAVFGVGASKPSVAEEVPTPKARSASIDIDQWPQWKAKAQAGRALLSYLTQLYKLSGSKANANMSDGIISRLYQHIVPNGSEKYTHNKVGAIIQRADMDEVNRTNVTQQALDFLEQDVSAYSSNLYEQLTQKSGVALYEIDAADDVINALYPERMRVVKQLYDLSNKLISVRDDLNTLRSSTRSAVYVETPESEAITDPATRCLFKYCLELLHWEGVAHKMARGGKAELMQEIEMLRRAAGLDKEKATHFQQIFDALMQKAKADPDEADFMLRGIAQRAYDGINRIDFKWEKFLPTMAYQERAFNVREMKVMRYLVAFWEDNLKAMGDLTGISQAAVASLTAAMDYATKVGDAIAQEKSTGRPKSDRMTETDMSA